GQGEGGGWGGGLGDRSGRVRPEADRPHEADPLTVGAELVDDVADELGRRPERDDDRLRAVAERGLDAPLLTLDVGELRGDRAQVALDAGRLVPVLAEPERRDETRFTASAERAVHRT